MKIVILDKIDIELESKIRLEKLGSTILYDNNPKDIITKHIDDADIILTSRTSISRNILEHLHKCIYIGILETRYDFVDIVAAKEKNIIVTNVPAYRTNITAQTVFALILHFCQLVQNHNQIMRKHNNINNILSTIDFQSVEIYNKTIGFLGFGSVAEQTATIGRAFGMKVLANDMLSRESIIPDLRWVNKEEIYASSDFISCHLQYNKELTGVINKDAFALFKPNAYFVNTANVNAVCIKDLVEALNEDRIAGAGIVITPEISQSNFDLLKSSKNCILIPPPQFVTREVNNRMIDIAIQNLEEYLKGNPTNVINKYC